MYCKYCGKQIPDNARYCPSCGKYTGAKSRSFLTVGSYVVWGGCLVSFVSLFLNFYQITVVNQYSLRFIDTNYCGLIIALMIVIAVLNLFRIYVGDLIGTGVIAIIVGVCVSRAGDLFGTLDSLGSRFGADAAGAVVSYGSGLPVMITGLALMLIGAIYGLIVTVLAQRKGQPRKPDKNDA